MQEARVDVNILYHCGCEYKTNDIAEAIKHVKATGHVLLVGGDIRRSKDVGSRQKRRSAGMDR